MQPYSVSETLFRHNLWANLQLIDVCATLTAEQLNSSTVGGYGSISDTLQHLVTSEESYFYRIRTGNPLIRDEETSPMSFVEMAELLQQSGQGLIEWASKIQPTDTVEIVWKNGQPTQVPKAIVLTQVINHATEHREQIMAILTHLGIEPPELSGWEYFDARVLK